MATAKQMKPRVIQIRLMPDTLELLEKTAGRSKSQYIEAVLRDALDRGVQVTTGGTIVEDKKR